jgi:uncharacterized membrane protein
MPTDWLELHWFPTLLAVLAGAAAVGAGLRRSSFLGHVAAGCGLAALGTVLDAETGIWVAAAGAGAFALLLAVLIASSSWSPWLARVAAAAAAFGLGGWVGTGAGPALGEALRTLRSLEATEPNWLILLALLPVAAAVSRRSLLVTRLPAREALRPWKHPVRWLAALLMVAGVAGAAWWVGYNPFGQPFDWSAGKSAAALRLTLAVGYCLTGVVLAAAAADIALFWHSGLDTPSLLRHGVSLAVRCGLVAAVVLALAELRLRQPIDSICVIYLVDRSLSIPQDPDPAAREDAPDYARDRRWQRVRRFLNDAAAGRGRRHERDESGVILFGRRPRLVLPPSDAPRLNFTDDLLADVDPYYTDIGAALKLALASFPEGVGKRVVLISDGNENLGSAEEQARLAKLNAVEIDAVPLAAGARDVNEVLIERVEAPARTQQGARPTLHVQVRNATRPPRAVVGALVLHQSSGAGGTPREVPIVPGPGVLDAGGPDRPARVRLKPGLNSFTFQPQLANEQRSYTYEATFTPLESGVEVPGGPDADRTPGLAGDRPQNNKATAHVIAAGRRRVLFVEGENKKGEQRLLVDRLRKTFTVDDVTSADLRQEAAQRDLKVYLSDYDCVVLANVPADELQPEHQEALRTNTHEQGCGLVMVGGPDAYGAGGYQDTAVEAALPVDCDVKALEVAGKGGLVLIFHASEISEGVRWQKEVAKLAVKKLAASDMVGVLYWDWGHKWHIPFGPIGTDRDDLLRRIEKMTPNDMPDCNPSFNMAYDALTDPKNALATRHIIFISDGDHWTIDKDILARLNRATPRITCSTVCITSHGNDAKKKMAEIAEATGGKDYAPDSPRKLPAIYVREARRVSQAFISKQTFEPTRTGGGPLEGLRPGPLPPLHGFVRTTLKPAAGALASLEGPAVHDQHFPVLAYWQYGLGRAVAFTSDARTQTGANAAKGWDVDWVESPSGVYQNFWDRVIGWAMRGVENDQLVMTTEYRDGTVRVVVDARDPKNKNRPLTDLQLRGSVSPPTGGSAKSIDLTFRQTASGRYEAEFKAEEAGSYIVNSRAVRPGQRDGKETLIDVGGTRAGVTLSYSPEFADLESNPRLLERLASMTGGQVYSEDRDELDRLAKSGDLYRPGPAGIKTQRPFWHWLALLAGLGLVFDVAVRRIAVEPEQVRATLGRFWDRLRGRRAVASETPQFLDRLGRAKAGAGTATDRGRAARKFEAPAAPAAPPPPRVDEAPSTRPPAAPQPPRPAAPPAAEPGQAEDYFERMRRAKKRARGEGDQPPEDEGRPS